MTSDLLLLAVYFAGLVIAIVVPARIRRAHVKAQNRLLDRCRAFYVLGAEAFEKGGRDRARSYLATIQRIEARWRFGNSLPFRFAMAMSAIATGIAGYVLLRFGALYLLGASNGNTPIGTVIGLQDLQLLSWAAWAHCTRSTPTSVSGRTHGRSRTAVIGYAVFSKRALKSACGLDR